MTTYLLNSPVLTAYGDWQLQGPLSVEDARSILATGYVSSIGHAGSAEFLSVLLDMKIEVCRETIQMKPGDQAVVFRLLKRLKEGEVFDGDGLKQLPFELALLRFVKGQCP